MVVAQGGDDSSGSGSGEEEQQLWQDDGDWWWIVVAAFVLSWFLLFWLRENKRKGRRWLQFSGSGRGRVLVALSPCLESYSIII